MEQGIKQHSSASTRLLGRAIPANYRAAQTEQIAQSQQVAAASKVSALIFRLGHEWFALPSVLCHQVLEPLTAHTIPHRSNQTLLGVVNVRGQMLLKVSLLQVLGLSRDTSDATTVKHCPRMVVVEKAMESGGSDTWVFDVDELYGIQPVLFSELEPPATGTGNSPATCTRYLFLWQGIRVNFLDDIRLFETLRQQAL